jgi:hypothetical protein
LAGAFVFAAGSGFDRRAEDFDSGSDADAFFFVIYPLIKHTWVVWYHKTYHRYNGPDGEWGGTNKTRMKDEFP